jgi:hypothetical protein
MPYHLTSIPKGVLNEFSKIQEEFLECQDAFNQNNPVMTLLELSDLIGAIEAFSKTHYNVSLENLIKMKDTTESAFKDGTRTSSVVTEVVEDPFKKYIEDFRIYFLSAYTEFIHIFKISDWGLLRFNDNRIKRYYEDSVSPESVIESFLNTKDPLILNNDINGDKFIIINKNEFVKLGGFSYDLARNPLQNYIYKLETFLKSIRPHDNNKMHLDNFIISNFALIKQSFDEDISVEDAYKNITKPQKENIGQLVNRASADPFEDYR